MARGDSNLRVVITGDTRGLDRATRSASRSLDKLGKDTTLHARVTSRGFSAIGVAARGAGAAAFAGGAGVAYLVKQYTESAKVGAQTNAVLKSTAGAANVTAKEVSNLATAISRKTGIDDEAIQSSENMLLTFTNLRNEAGKGNQVFSEATRVVTDMSVALGQDGKNSAIQLGKALNDPIKGITALRRVGVSFTQQQQDQIKALTESGHRLQAQKLILRELNKEFGGSAQAQANPFDKLKVSVGNLAEELGGALAPTLSRLATRLTKFTIGIEDGTGAGGRFRKQMEHVWGEIVKVGETLEDVGGFLKDHIGLIKLAATAWVGYRIAATAAALAGRRAAATAVGGAAAGGAGGVVAGAAGAAGRVSRLGRFAGIAGGPAGLVVGAGGFKAVTDAIKGASSSDLGLLNGYAGALERVAKAGDSGGMRKLASQLRETAAANRDATKGEHLKAFANALDMAASSGGKDLGALKAAFKSMGKSTGGDLNDVARNIQKLQGTANSELSVKLKRTLGDMDDRFKAAKDNTGDKLQGIRSAVQSNMKEVKRRLGSDSQDGKQALAHNFSDAADAVRTQMRRGTVTTREGMKQIRGYLADELRVYGFSLSQARNIAKTGDPDANKGREGGAFRAAGGWIGNRGQVGTDVVPAMLAPGEAVLNRHQQAVVEGMLGDGFLDTLFSKVQKPHYLAKGGRAGIGGAVAAANQLEKAHFPYLWGGGHQSSPARFGPMDCSGAVSYVLQHAGVGIPTMTSGQLANAGKPGPGALTVYANAEHTLMRIGNRFFGTSGSNPGGGAGWMPNPGSGYLSRFAVRHFMGGGGDGSFDVGVKAPRIRGGGAVGSLVQRALGMAAGAASKFGTRAVGSMGLGTGDQNNPAVGGGSASQNMALARQMAAGRGWKGAQWNALRSLWTRESGFRTTATNASSGAYGIPQALPGSKMASVGADWRTNPATQIRWGLGYISGRYGSPAGAWAHSQSAGWYARGGRVPGFARGKKGKPGRVRIKSNPFNHPFGYGIGAVNAGRTGLTGGMWTGTELEGIQAEIAMAALTATLADDIVGAQHLETYWQGQYKAARKSRNPVRIARVAGELASARSSLTDLRSAGSPGGGDTGDPNQALIDAMTALTEAQNAAAALEQQRIDLEKQMVANQNKLIYMQNTQGPQLLSAVIAAVSGGIGGKVGLGFQSVGYAGGVARS